MTSRVGKLLEILSSHSASPQGLTEMDDDYADDIGAYFQIVAPRQKIDEWIGPFEDDTWLTRKGLAKILYGLDQKYGVETRVTYYAGNKFCTLGLNEGAANNPFKDKTFFSYYILLESGRVVLIPSYFLKRIS